MSEPVAAPWLDDETVTVEEIEFHAGERESAAESQLVHSLLIQLHSDTESREARIDRVMDAITAEDDAPAPFVLRRTTLQWAMAAAIVLAAVIGFLNLPDNTAMAALDRLIEVSSQMVDRTYVIIADSNEAPRPKSDHPKHIQPPINGAVLHVRGPDQYVLIRANENGDKWFTGCNGREAWSFHPNPKRPVHVSSDLTRFRGKLPGAGSQQSIPFTNIRSDLDQLRDAYEIELVESNRLRGVKRSHEHRGPKLIDIQFDSKTGVIERMTLDKLPRAKGGPKSLTIELIEQRDLGQDFFNHENHHASDREVRHEE